MENGSKNATSSLVLLSSPNFEQVKMLCSPVVSIVKVIALACFSVKTLTDGRGSLFSPPFLVDQYYIGCFSNSDPQVNWLQAETPVLSTVSLYSVSLNFIYPSKELCSKTASGELGV